MFSVYHLQQQRSEFKRYYDSLSELIGGLRDNLVYETDPAFRLKLERQIKDREAERNEIVEQIQSLEDKIESIDHSIKLRKALAKLNYHAQGKLFQQLVDISPIGAFVIYGKSGYGQSWLLSRLVGQVPNYRTGKIFPVRLPSWAPKWDIEALKHTLRQSVGLKHPDSLQQVAEQVHRLWQTQTVILIFHGLGVMDTESINSFMKEFWLYLVNKAPIAPRRSMDYRLLMFLVESSDTIDIDTWPVDYAEQIDMNWEPCMLVKPPKLTTISRADLTQWVKYEYATLPAQVRGVPIEDIFRNSKYGAPQKLLEYICQLCNCNWYELTHSHLGRNTYGQGIE